MPVVAVWHGNADIHALYVGDDDVGGAIPARDNTHSDDHLTIQTSTVPGENLGPEDELKISPLVLYGNEYGVAFPTWVLFCHRPSCHKHHLPILHILDGDGWQYL